MNDVTAQDINTAVPRIIPGNSFLHRNFTIIKSLLTGGFNGSFISGTKTVTIVNGIITNVEDT